MGYVNLTDICQFIPPATIQKTLGTWTPAVSADVVSEVRSAADAAFDLLIPLALPGSQVGLQAAKLQSVDVWYKIATVAADDFAVVELDRIGLNADTVAISGSNPAISLDAAHDTAAKRKALGSHKMTVTLTTPVFIEKNSVYALHLSVDAAATTVFTLYGAQVNYTLRL